MKLSDHVEQIRTLIHKSFNNQFSRLGVGSKTEMPIDRIPSDLHNKRKKIDILIKSHTNEVGTYEDAREKALDELTFTLFNRLAATKVMEAHKLFPPILTKQAEHGDRSFGHKIWLEQNPNMRIEELEGLRNYLKDEFNKLGESIPLYNKNYPYALLPYVIDLNEIINAFNAVEDEPQIDDNIWQSDDILGWLYESYNNTKKAIFKESKAKTEYDKVSLQSQVYTPRWVVEFLVNNSLGKLYLEMYPDSEIATQYKIANAPKSRVRDIKPLHEIKLIDPASGSGNFLLYAFSFFYALYIDQIENYGADYDEDNIAQLIIENNLHGIDLDDRAIQLAQLGLWIKAKQKQRSIGTLKFNVISSDFFLPDFDFVYPIFKASTTDSKQLSVIEEIWEDLQQAHKFGSLVKLEEKLSFKLHGLVEQKGVTLFGDQEEKEYHRFKNDFFTNLETAVSRYATQQGNSFLTDKTRDAINFLKLLTQKYDVATTNPPYTDSSDFGHDLKKFIEANYKKPYKFNTNLYATFIKRCYELTTEIGKISIVHPPTFMYIKTFEDVRKFILDKTHIDLLVEWGFIGMFNPTVRVDASMYVLDKQIKKEDTTFIKLNHIYEGKRYEAFVDAYDKLITNNLHANNYKLPQSKLKIINSWPFIYWISDTFREKFRIETVDDVSAVRAGIQTSNNNRFLRFWWEIKNENISEKYSVDKKRWVKYSKGGPFNKWFGNIWLVIDWEFEGQKIQDFLETKKLDLHAQPYYYLEGLTYSATGGKPSFRYLPKDHLFDIGGASVFLIKNYTNVQYLAGLLNSTLTKYIINCLNPTVNVQPIDIKRVPFIIPEPSIEKSTSELSLLNTSIKKYLCSFNIVELNFKNSPLKSKEGYFQSMRNHTDLCNMLITQVLLNEAVINKNIIYTYGLTENDKAILLTTEGECIGALPVYTEAKQAYLNNEVIKFPLDDIRDYIEALPIKKFDATEREAIENEFSQLYQSNNDIEELCIRHQINPINVWYWFKQSNIIPKQRMNKLAMEFLADMLREILMEDEDGIIPLVPNAGEKILLDRIEEKFIEKGFSMAQYSTFDSVLGKELNEYINNHFFKAFSDHLNLFQYLPKTPFIWHLTSGPEQGFDCYIIIYKWNRDKLLAIRSKYIENRERALVNRQSDLLNVETAAAQNEKETIYKQLKEIESFKQKIDELLEEGYNPILDDGVGKNIAPLQNKGMIPYEVLNKGQLKKYLNADW